MEDLRYPVGKFDSLTEVAVGERDVFIREISELPAKLQTLIQPLTEKQLDTPYRPEGWTVRQVVHHIPDSHLNAYIRCKLALTEANPTIKPYHEDLWAQLIDSRDTPIDVSLTLLSALHARWVTLLNAMTDTDYSRTFLHPEFGQVSLFTLVRMYAWHGRHHCAHIESLCKRNGWI